MEQGLLSVKDKKHRSKFNNEISNIQFQCFNDVILIVGKKFGQ